MMIKYISIALFFMVNLCAYDGNKQMKLEIFSKKNHEVEEYFNRKLDDSDVSDLSHHLNGIESNILYLDENKIRVFIDNADITLVPVMTTIMIDFEYHDGKFIKATLFKKAFT